jgi:hypothetical protein
MPTSVRLDDNTQRLLQRMANRKSQTKSEVIRRAIETLAEVERLDEESPEPRELVADLIGCVSGGPVDLSTQTGKRFADLLGSKKG